MSRRDAIASWAKAINWKAPACWAAAFTAAAGHTWLLVSVQYPVGMIGWLLPLAAIAPGLLTMIILTGAQRRWYRWAALLGLTLTTFPAFLPLVLVTGETWALHRSWVTERNGIRIHGKAHPPLGVARMKPGKPKVS